MTAETPLETRRQRHGRGRRRPSRGAAVLGVVGELLITLGVLVGLFVVWQLWWTDVVAEREQAQLVEDLGWAWQPQERPEPAPTPTASPTDAPPAPTHHTEPAPAEPDPAHATTFATLLVPRWGQDYVRPISEGTSKHDVLDVLGIGHYEGTAMPGTVGNFAIAGHRVTYGKPFNRIEELQIGDPLVVQTQQAWYVYRVTSTQVVSPQDVSVIQPVPGQRGAAPTQALMTLTTCHPMFSARERFIVHAQLDYWMAAADGTPDEIQGD